MSPMPLTVTVSVGIAVGDRSSPGELLRDADMALYLAKAAGKNCFEVFHPEMDTDIRRVYELEFDLRSRSRSPSVPARLPAHLQP